jgi:hypothetical protein
MSDTNGSETVMSVAGDRDEAANFDVQRHGASE